MATDIIIKYKKGIVLIDRKNFPYGIALSGGIAERMTFSQNAVKESREETGLAVRILNPKRPLCVSSDVNQDPREFIASVTYIGIGKGKLKPCKEEDAKSAKVYPFGKLAEMIENPGIWAFPSHHPKIIRIFLEQEGYQWGKKQNV